MTRVKSECSNYQGSNMYCNLRSENIKRECSDSDKDVTSQFTEMLTKRMEGCGNGDSCNVFIPALDFEQLDPLPTPDRWHMPLNENEQEIYCGFGGENCITCDMCAEVKNSIESNKCAASWGLQGEKAQTYRRRFYDFD